jgi:DNA topoisomerase VI subunit B
MKKQALSPAPQLDRITFCTSREMDFFSEKELVTQTGHCKEEWPLVIVKELIDNALDACEEADIAPTIEIAADAGSITVRDNGPGLPESTLKSTMDFSIRVSSREAYVAPDRGAQGNALKTILPMPVVLDPQHGGLIVEAHGKRHVITCGTDLSQRAIIRDGTVDVPTVGTAVRIEWLPESGWPFCRPLNAHSCRVEFHRIVEGFAIFNPHATFRLDWFGELTTWEATEPNWQKWKPHKPTSPHWYEVRHLEGLIGNHVVYDRRNGADRLVSDFISQFNGLAGSKKRTEVLSETDLHRAQGRGRAMPGRRQRRGPGGGAVRAAPFPPWRGVPA